MNLLLIAAVAAGIYGYKKNENFKNKADEVGKSIKDLAKTSAEELRKKVKK